MTVTEFARQSEMKLTSWTDRIFKTAGVRISDFNIVKMIKLCDFSMSRLKSESDKLISYCKRNNLDSVPNEIVELMVKPSGENAVYEFTDAVLRRSKKEACTLLENLKQQNVEAIALVASLAKTFNALALVKSARGKITEQEFATLTGCFPWQLRTYTAASEGFEKEALQKAIHLTLLCDSDLKSVSVPPYVLVENLVVSVL